MKRIGAEFIEFESNSIYQYLALVIITLIAAVLRFYKLGEWSFWGDEMITVSRAQNIFNHGFTLKPISLMLTNLALTWLGTSEWSARLVPALIGVASIPILYFFIKKMFNPTVALVATLLLAVSPWHLYWSQNARFYSSLLLLYTLALLIFYFGIEEDRPWYLLLSLFLLGLAIQERLLALFFVPVVVCYLVLLKILPFEKPPGFRPRNLALFFLPGLIAVLFRALPYVQQPTRWQAEFAQFFVWTNNDPLWILAGTVYYVGLPTICMGGLGGLYLLTKKDRASLLLSLGALVPLLAIMVISLVYYTANRYVFVSLISWIILASVATKELLWQAQKNAKILAIGTLLILLLAPLSENMLYYKYQNGNRDNWQDAFVLVKQQKGENDLVVVPDTRLGDYYLQEKTISMARVDLVRIEEIGNRVWFVEDMNVQWKYPHVLDWMEENTHQVANMDVYVRARSFKMRVYLYDPDKLSLSQVSR